jgi:hypothetical protein
MLTPIAYAAVVAPFSECDVQAKPSGGVGLHAGYDEMHPTRKRARLPVGCLFTFVNRRTTHGGLVGSGRP